MVRDVMSYLRNREGVLGLGPSRERINKLNRVPGFTLGMELEMTKFSYLRPGVKFSIREGVKNVAPGIGEIVEIRKDDSIVFVDAVGNRLNMLKSSPLLREENIVK